MKPRIKLAEAATPDGGEMVLFQHDRDFIIMVNGVDLMHSRRHESEFALARLACTNLGGQEQAKVLIGGLGLGYTLRQTLDCLTEGDQIVIAELMADIVQWNSDFVGQLAGDPLKDQRVSTHIGDVYQLIIAENAKYDAIILDVDNGPEAMSLADNQQLYSYQGITACRHALRAKGVLAVWSAAPSKKFERLLQDCGFQVRRYRVPAHKGKNPDYHFVWLASESKKKLPPGGGEPRNKPKNKNKGRRFR